MNLAHLANSTQKLVKQNGPTILTALGVSGTLGTAYLAGRASWKASARLSEGSPLSQLSKREIVEQVWDLYLPAAVSAAVTVGCIIGANHVSSQRVAAAYSVLAISEKGASEYRQAVIERLGEKKEKEIRDQVAQEHVTSNPPPQTLVLGDGSVICCELFTGRYFPSDMETIRRSVNDINQKLHGEMYATLNDFYYMLGIEPTSSSGQFGWGSGKQLELLFSSALTKDNKPCLTFEYNYLNPLKEL